MEVTQAVFAGPADNGPAALAAIVKAGGWQITRLEMLDPYGWDYVDRPLEPWDGLGPQGEQPLGQHLEPQAHGFADDNRHAFLLVRFATAHIDAVTKALHAMHWRLRGHTHIDVSGPPPPRS
jgi:hypothetical protein